MQMMIFGILGEGILLVDCCKAVLTNSRRLVHMRAGAVSWLFILSNEGCCIDFIQLYLFLVFNHELAKKPSSWRFRWCPSGVPFPIFTPYSFILSLLIKGSLIVCLGVS